MNDITVGVKAFIRIAVLERALASLEGHDFAEVIVADDSNMDETRHALYQRFRERLPLKVLELPFRSGVSFGRNRMVEACSSPYFLLMDDDLAMESDIHPMLQVLESNTKIGGVTALETKAGNLSSGCGNLHIFKNFVVHDIGYGSHRKAKTLADGTRYYTYEMINNFTLFRTAVFNDVVWDEYYLIGRDHMDFYLTHKKLGKWQFALTPDCTYAHSSEDAGELAILYQKFRASPDTFELMSNYFNNKWGLDRGVIWGLSHMPERRALKGPLIHTMLGVSQLFQQPRQVGSRPGAIR